MPESRKAFCRIVSLTAAKTNRICRDVSEVYTFSQEPIWDTRGEEEAARLSDSLPLIGSSPPSPPIGPSPSPCASPRLPVPLCHLPAPL